MIEIKRFQPYDGLYGGEGGEQKYTPTPQEQILLDALKELSVLGNGDRPGNSHGNVIAQKALASHREITGLEITP